jgi:hypothetical protein
MAACVCVPEATRSHKHTYVYIRINRYVPYLRQSQPRAWLYSAAFAAARTPQHAGCTASANGHHILLSLLPNAVPPTEWAATWY